MKFLKKDGKNTKVHVTISILINITLKFIDIFEIMVELLIALLIFFFITHVIILKKLLLKKNKSLIYSLII